MALVPPVGRRESRRAPGRSRSLGLGSQPAEVIIDALLSALRDDAWQVREEAAATR